MKEGEVEAVVETVGGGWWVVLQKHSLVTCQQLHPSLRRIFRWLFLISIRTATVDVCVQTGLAEAITYSLRSETTLLTYRFIRMKEILTARKKATRST